MLRRPTKFLAVLITFSFLFFTLLFISTSSPSSSSTSTPYTNRARSFLARPEHGRRRQCEPVRSPVKASRHLKSTPAAVPIPAVVPDFPTPATAVKEFPRDGSSFSTPNTPTTTSSSSSSPSDQTYLGPTVEEGQTRYLMYVPYAGVTNQLISIWHGSLIAKALNRTLLIPNLSPNVHIEGTQDPVATRWSEFFDLETYSARTGLAVEELDTFLARRGIVEQQQDKDQEQRILRRRRKRSAEDTSEAPSTSTEGGKARRQNHRKRWVQVAKAIQHGQPMDAISAAPAPTPTVLSASESSSSSSSSTTTLHKRVKFPAVQKCFSEAGYGADRRVDMTGRRFMQRYGIDSTLIPTPFLDPERDNGSIWMRWRMDKVIERYQHPQYEQQEILCLGHVYRLLPGGIHRAWVEFGQHLHYTEEVQEFVDEILEKLLPKKDDDGVQQDSSSSRTTETTAMQEAKERRPFVGVHLRRGDFKRHCLGITSPADPNGWNRCYPSTEHIISLLSTNPRTESVHHRRGLYKRETETGMSSSPTSSSATTFMDPSFQQWPVLVLTNEHDPQELAKADAENWIRVNHHELGTLERFGRYGPILLDGALLARASLLVGVEYSTYFKTASKRAEAWFGGKTLFVT